jgi:hypothetical protein
MRIKSESTIDDQIYAYERIMARSNAARSWRRQGTVATALLSGLISGILIFIIVGGSIPAGIFFGCLAAMPSAAIAWRSHQNTIKRRLETYYREKFGDRKSFPVEVELTEVGVSTKQLGTQIIFEWSNVGEINETEDMIEIYTRNGGGVFLKKKDFSSTDEYRQFIKVAQTYLNASRTSSNWLQAG